MALGTFETNISVTSWLSCPAFYYVNIGTNCLITSSGPVPQFGNLTCFFRYLRLCFSGGTGKIRTETNFRLTSCPSFVGTFSSVKTFHTILQPKSNKTGIPFLVAKCLFLTSVSIRIQVRTNAVKNIGPYVRKKERKV